MTELAKVKHESVSFGALMQNIRDGKIRIPDFQREFVWELNQIISLLAVREKYSQQGYSQAVIDTLLQARRLSTSKQYKTHQDRWLKHCTRHNVNTFEPTVGQVEFLQSLVSQGLCYSTDNCARSTLSLLVSVDGVPVGEHREICRFIKGVSNIRHHYLVMYKYGTQKWS